eukprot:gene3898-13968_t
MTEEGSVLSMHELIDVAQASDQSPSSTARLGTLRSVLATPQSDSVQRVLSKNGREGTSAEPSHRSPRSMLGSSSNRSAIGMMSVSELQLEGGRRSASLAPPNALGSSLLMHRPWLLLLRLILQLGMSHQSLLYLLSAASEEDIEDLGMSHQSLLYLCSAASGEDDQDVSEELKALFPAGASKALMDLLPASTAPPVPDLGYRSSQPSGSNFFGANEANEARPGKPVRRPPPEITPREETGGGWADEGSWADAPSPAAAAPPAGIEPLTLVPPVSLEHSASGLLQVMSDAFRMVSGTGPGTAADPTPGAGAGAGFGVGAGVGVGAGGGAGAGVGVCSEDASAPRSSAGGMRVPPTSSSSAAAGVGGSSGSAAAASASTSGPAVPGGGNLLQAGSKVAEFFGYLGLFNTIMMSPVAAYLFLTGDISLSTIPREAYMYTMQGILAYVMADYMWARGVMIIGPTIATVCQSIQIPVAAAADLLLGTPTWAESYHSIVMALAGTLLILFGLFGINMLSGEEPTLPKTVVAIKSWAVMKAAVQMKGVKGVGDKEETAPLKGKERAGQW